MAPLSVQLITTQQWGLSPLLDSPAGQVSYQLHLVKIQSGKCTCVSQLEDCKNTFETRVTIKFLLSKHTFKLKCKFATEIQTLCLDNVQVATPFGLLE